MMGDSTKGGKKGMMNSSTKEGKKGMMKNEEFNRVVE